MNNKRGWIKRHGRLCAVLATAAFAWSAASSFAQEAGKAEGAAPKIEIVKKSPGGEPKEGATAVKGVEAAKPAAPDGPQPKIQFDQPKYDFGEAWSGSKVDHTFEVRNTGPGVLQITKVKPACGCTLAGAYDKEIQPGAVGKIPLSINTARMKNKITKTITVESNDTTNDKFVLTVEGNVKDRFDIQPESAGAFGRIRPDEVLERKLTLTSNMPEPVKLTLAAEKEGVFTAELVEKEPGKLYELTLHAKPPYAEKINRGVLKLNTSLPDNQTVDVQLSAFVPPEVEITPPELIISKAQTEASQQSIRVTFNGSNERKITKATVDFPNVTTEVKEIAPSHYDILLGLPANYMPPVASHTLKLTTDDPKNPEVAIKISPPKSPEQTQTRPALTLLTKPVPEAKFTMADGKTISTTEMKEDATLVMFYASWCGFCKRALPEVEKMSKEYAGKSARILCVSMDTIKDGTESPDDKRAKTKDEIFAQFKELNVSLPQALDLEKVGGSKFSVQSFPTFFLFGGKSGKVERVYVGGGGITDGSIKKDIEALLAGQELAVAPPPPPTPPPARPASELEGKPAPAAGIPLAADGSTVSLADGSANATVAFFYASWCPHCKKAVPGLSQMYTEYQSKGVRFIGISEDTFAEQADPNNKRIVTKDIVTQQWKDLGANFPQALDTGGVGRNDYKVQSFPTMFLIDKAGTVNKVYMGAGSVNDGSLKKDIEAVLAKKAADAAPATGGATLTAGEGAKK